MAPKSTSSRPPSLPPPSYGSIDIEADHRPHPTLFTPSPHHDSPSTTPRDPRGWIHACFGLQGARGEDYDEKAFQTTLFLFMGFVTVVAGVVGIMYIVPGAGIYLWIMGMVGMCLGVVVLRSRIRGEQQMYSGWGVTGTYHRG